MDSYEAFLQSLVAQNGAVMDLKTLARVLKRQVAGLRFTIAKGTSEFAMGLRSIRIRQGRRILFSTSDVARLLWDLRGRR